MKPAQNDMRPKVSFGLPVRNAEHSIERVVSSVLAQTFDDFELVVSDNASTDRTSEICRRFASEDVRVRFDPNPEDIGLLANFNRLVGIARGEYFRWIGADDWLEPEYAEHCVRALDANPQAIGVTTYQAHWDGTGQRLYREYTGPRVDSDQPEERFARMLRLLHSDYGLFDPIYTMYRREALASTQLHRMMACADRALAAELSLLGPYCHVPKCLSNRRRADSTLDELARKCRPPGYPELDISARYRLRVFRAIIRDASLPRSQTLSCLGSAYRYYARELLRRARKGWNQTARPALRRFGVVRRSSA